MNRRTFLQSGAAALALSATEGAGSVRAGEAPTTLYNGIRLPAPWPPRLATLTNEPMAVPYLATPAVIPIDLGRQLFVDNFLIEHGCHEIQGYLFSRPVSAKAFPAVVNQIESEKF